MTAHCLVVPVQKLLKRSRVALLAGALCLQMPPATATGFQLPHDKRYIESCQAAALVAHPGNVERVIVHNDEAGVRVRFYIQKQGERAQWIVICDGKTGKILKTIVVDDS